MAVPTNRLARLPSWVSHWLGYRASPPAAAPLHVVYIWSFVGSFCGLSVLMAILSHAHPFVDRHVPLIIASYGASAVLCFGSIDLPLGQPRALFGGHFVSALVGICVTKLFQFLPAERFESLRWLDASLSTAIAIVAMQITKTTHPPAGATALLPAVDADIRALSWYLLPVCLLSSAIILVIALLLNNIQRRYPTFWIQPTVPTAQISAPTLPMFSPPEVTATLSYQKENSPR